MGLLSLVKEKDADSFFQQIVLECQLCVWCYFRRWDTAMIKINKAPALKELRNRHK